MRVMGIDPGLTRCGLGVVDVDASRRASLVYVGVARTDKDLATHFRLRTIADAIDSVIERYEPEVVAIERVFAQDNLQSVTTTMQVMGAAMTCVGRAGLPVYGTCAGMIMLASSILDGREDQRSFAALDMVVRRNAFGRQVDSYEEDLDVEGLEGGPFHAVFIRAPWVESVGEGVEVIARAGNSTDGPIVGVRRGNVMATSFHPEVGGDDRIHAMFVDMVACA